MYMQSNIDRKNDVKEYLKKVNMYIKNYNVISNRNVNKETNKRNKEKTYKYLWKNMKEYIKNRKCKICKMCKKFIQKPLACITSSIDLIYLIKDSW